MHLLSLIIALPLSWSLHALPVDHVNGSSPKQHAAIYAVDDHSAQVNFTSPKLPPELYAYEVRTSGLAGSGESGLVFSGKSLTNQIEINDLMPGMLYTVYVKYEYSNLEMQWVYGNSFNTSVCAPENKMELKFRLEDQKADGWNGTVLGIKQAGIEIGELSLEEGEFNSGSISICSEELTEIYIKHLGENSEDIVVWIIQDDQEYQTKIQQKTAFSNNQVIFSRVFSNLRSKR